MTQNFGRLSQGHDKVFWSELLPYEFKKRLSDCPVVYLPLGLCEPHGQIAAFGLDTIKAEWLCEQAARQSGGIVAPAMGYHIHESGYHARWLEETVGEENPHMTSMPPDVFLHFFLYQLRAFANAGFKAIVIVSGHSGGNQFDLRRVAEAFSNRTAVTIFAVSDPELVSGLYRGDHAGKYEISQLMYLRPDLIDFSKKDLADQLGSGGRLAIGSDADEASAEHGEAIMHACLTTLMGEAEKLKVSIKDSTMNEPPMLSYSDIETIWQELQLKQDPWKTSIPAPNQHPVSKHSQWKKYEG